jgi:hypothetical protein
MHALSEVPPPTLEDPAGQLLHTPENEKSPGLHPHALTDVDLVSVVVAFPGHIVQVPIVPAAA